jgi:hypothetical protein
VSIFAELRRGWEETGFFEDGGDVVMGHGKALKWMTRLRIWGSCYKGRREYTSNKSPVSDRGLVEMINT